MKILLQHINKKNDSSSETAFKYLIQRRKVNNHNHVFQILFHEIFLEDKLKIQELCANSQSTMAIFFWFGPRVSMRKTCNLKRRQLFAMATRFRTRCCLDKEALLAKYEPFPVKNQDVVHCIEPIKMQVTEFCVWCLVFVLNFAADSACWRSSPPSNLFNNLSIVASSASGLVNHNNSYPAGNVLYQCAVFASASSCPIIYRLVTSPLSSTDVC